MPITNIPGGAQTPTPINTDDNDVNNDADLSLSQPPADEDVETDQDKFSSSPDTAPLTGTPKQGGDPSEKKLLNLFTKLINNPEQMDNFQKWVPSLDPQNLPKHVDLGGGIKMSGAEAIQLYELMAAIQDQGGDQPPADAGETPSTPANTTNTTSPDATTDATPPTGGGNPDKTGGTGGT